MATRSLALFAISGFPIVREGDDLCHLIVQCLSASGDQLRDRDVLVVTQKIVSKAEGRRVSLNDVKPGERARQLATESGKDPRLVEVILSETRAVLRVRHGLIVVEHRLGFVAANAGVDQSNIGPANKEDIALLLPLDPDASCRRLRRSIRERLGVDVAVLINDSLGRAWRHGTVGTALGMAGLPALEDYRGRPDLFGRELRTTVVGFADGVAAAASLLQGEADEGTPVVVIRGLAPRGASGTAADLLRPRELDLFR